MSAPSRPSLSHARRVRVILGALAAVGSLVVVVLALTGGLHLGDTNRDRDVPTGPAPWDFSLAEWDLALGGDEGLTAANFALLAQHVDADLDGHDVALRTLAEQVALADLTGVAQSSIAALTPAGVAPYWPAPSRTSVSPAPQCSDVDVLAVAPAALPVTGSDALTLGLFSEYAKTLVAYTGACGATTYDLASPGIVYVYGGLGESGWVPLRYWQIPSDSGHDTIPGATEPYDWELRALATNCTTGTVVRARIAVAEAFELMCAAAAAEGVDLSARAGFRTRAEQALLFSEAIEVYGSEEAARQRVAFADETVCTSRHCSGLALNVEEKPAQIAWLTTTVGCVAPDGAVTAAAECAPGQTPVPNAARWGFAAPLAVSPGYIEFTLPVGADASSSLGTPNCNPAGMPIANQVAAIFRCRLARDGIVGPEQQQVVAEALTISRCESGWNATAAAFGGRFASNAHPLTGHIYSHRGVFMLPEEVTRSGWVVGGMDAVNDPIANINAAASLWLSTRGWEQFGCATGADPGGFEAGPVLPLYGGPALPAWAHTY